MKPSSADLLRQMQAQAALAEAPRRPLGRNCTLTGIFARQRSGLPSVPASTPVPLPDGLELGQPLASEPLPLPDAFEQGPPLASDPLPLPDAGEPGEPLASELLPLPEKEDCAASFDLPPKP